MIFFVIRSLKKGEQLFLGFTDKGAEVKETLMFDIQLPLSIFSPGSLGAASLTALDMEVVAAAGFTDLTDLAQQQKMLAQLQTGWLRQAPQKQFLVLPVFAKKRRVLFAGNAAGANQMRTTGACGDGGVTNRQDPPYKMSAALSALRCVI